jgi:hypothetical protein
VELEELHNRMAGVESERATEVMKLPQSFMEISDALVDLGVFSIWDILLHLKSAQDAMIVAGLILEHLQEEHASRASS